MQPRLLSSRKLARLYALDIRDRHALMQPRHSPWKYDLTQSSAVRSRSCFDAPTAFAMETVLPKPTTNLSFSAFDAATALSPWKNFAEMVVSAGSANPLMQPRQSSPWKLQLDKREAWALNHL
jgi:hypothetical protein